MTEVLGLDGVSLRRGENVLLDDITLSISEGEHWVVLGPNGAGKTTLVEIAAGRMHPSAGTATILDEQLGRVDVFELRPRIGYASAALASRIPQGETVFDLVITSAHGVVGRWTEEYEGQDDERAEALLWAFGVSHLRDRRFGTLSEGEKKRVQIARSLMTDPEILILDEPAAGLDLGGREELMRALTEIMSSKTAPVVLMVTHHVEEIPAGATHALLLKAGRIVSAGPLDVSLTPAHLSETFGLPVEVHRDGGRFHARAV